MPTGLICIWKLYNTGDYLINEIVTYFNSIGIHMYVLTYVCSANAYVCKHWHLTF
jgi:hypothetical protein